MEYNHPGVGTIVQSTWWVQCTHVHVVLQVMEITVCEGHGRREEGRRIVEGIEGEKRRGEDRMRRG